MSLAGFTEQEAVVVDVRDRMAWVEAQRQSACGSCAMAKGCGTATVGKAFRQRPSRILALNPVQARPGERVVVGVRSSVLVRGALWLYGFPLMTMFALPLLVEALFGGEEGLAEGWDIFFAVVGLGGGFLALKQVIPQGKAGDVQAVILRRCGEAAEGAPIGIYERNGERHG